MNAKQLIGKRAIRTAPTSMPDYSYCSSPILIVNATDTHIVYHSQGFGNNKSFEENIRILDCRFCDDNWTDYDTLINTNTLYCSCYCFIK